MATSIRRRRLGIRFLAALVPLSVALVVAATPAWAHVTVHPSRLAAGSSDVEITFRVPNERDNANTVELQVFFPSSLPLLTVDVLPLPGWSATVQTQTLAKPVQTDDGPVSQVVSEVTWKATDGGISQGQYEDFPISAGALPNVAGQLVFKSLQTYSSGEIVRWIEVPVAGQTEPDNPAPILTLTPGATTAASKTESSATGSSTNTEVIAIVALVVAFANTVVLVWMLVGKRRPKETS
jgi:uncharacterized protein YcnI